MASAPAAKQSIRRAPAGPAHDIDAQRILADLPVGIAVCELDPKAGHPLVFTNGAARDLFQIDESAARPPALESVPHLEYGEPLLEQFRYAARARRRVGFEWQLPHRGGTRHLQCDILPLDSSSGSAPRVLCIVTDRTEERRAASRLLEQALHDHLTGLPNRNAFRSLLDEVLTACRVRGDRHCAVLILNVDRFNRINESFSHAVGDAFLVELAGTLRDAISPYGTLARLSGDEFAVLLPDLLHIEQALECARAVHAAMAAPRRIDGIEAHCSLCIGIASTLTSRAYPENMMRDAHIALHQAKTHGRGRTEIYCSERNATHGGAIALESALRQAIETEALDLHFQPIVALDSRRVVAFEALARWTHPEYGPVSPATFIPLAEDSGLVVPLGRWVMRAACRQLRTWQEKQRGLDGLTVNVNLSTVQLLNDKVSEAVADALRCSALRPQCLRLEITESALVTDPERVAGILHQIKALGPSLALDDFGTGYSSLNYLSRFPLDCIKIDRSFISRIDTDPPAEKISRMICMLAEMLGAGLV
ncbi:MAG: putative bifunctional diguanylate cyclase/phosphodiesterase, partial [Rhodothalassiaceae bacterium]